MLSASGMGKLFDNVGSRCRRGMAGTVLRKVSGGARGRQAPATPDNGQLTTTVRPTQPAATGSARFPKLSRLTPGAAGRVAGSERRRRRAGQSLNSTGTSFLPALSVTTTPLPAGSRKRAGSGDGPAFAAALPGGCGSGGGGVTKAW